MNVRVAREHYQLHEDGNITEHLNCFIEPDDCSWIIWLDEKTGRPFLYNGNRDETGGVLDDGVPL